MSQATRIAELTDPMADIRSLIDQIRSVYVGSIDRAELALVALLSGGHVLIEDVPGVGKTTLASVLARALGCTFRRVQFTSDMLPADVIGINMYDQQEGRFRFRRGPLFANIVLADEINRTPPRTQSSLLEAMNDHHVTVDGVTHQLPSPFCVLATQNPFEFQGTYPLPESQLDRFSIRMDLGYPSTEQGIEIVRAQELRHPLEDVQPVIAADRISELQQLVRRIYVGDDVLRYIMALVEATRSHPDVSLGASPRSAVQFFRCCQALALIHSQDHVEPDDVKALAAPALAHRLRCHTGHTDGGTTSETGAGVIRDILDATPVPV
jgi:MoxR-like ATPase